jgi:hypothetical protein
VHAHSTLPAAGLRDPGQKIAIGFARQNDTPANELNFLAWLSWRQVLPRVQALFRAELNKVCQRKARQ